MPTFMGTLTLSSSSPQNSVEPEASGANKTSITEDIITPDNTATKVPDEASKEEDEKPIQTQPASMRSSRGGQGKKLDTDLAIVLENITAGYTRPNILDVKLGSQLWDALASSEKRARLDKVASETTSASLGFRVAGMKVWEGRGVSQSTLTTSTTSAATKTDGIQKGKEGSEGTRNADGYCDFGKVYGKQLTPENVSEAFRRFLFVDSAGVHHDLGVLMAKRFLEDIRGLRKMLEMEESRMYSASILFVYEGDGEALRKALQEEKDRENQGGGKGGLVTRDDQGVEIDGEVNDEEDDDNDDEDKELLKVHDIKLIDFAHASWTPGLGPDENALKGVRSVERILEDFSKSDN